MKGVSITKVEILLPMICLIFLSYKPAIAQSVNQPPEIHFGARTTKDYKTYKQDEEFELKKEEKVRENLSPFKLPKNSCVGACGKNSNNTPTNETPDVINPIKYESLPSDTNNRVYKWKDKNGAIHVTNTPSTIPKRPDGEGREKEKEH